MVILLTSRLETIESTNSRSNNNGNNIVKNNHENFALNQVVKYNGSNIKIWLSTVKSAFRSCGYSKFLESEILPNDPQYNSYENCLGTIRLMFESNKLEIIQRQLSNGNQVRVKFTKGNIFKNQLLIGFWFNNDITNFFRFNCFTTSCFKLNFLKFRINKIFIINCESFKSLYRT
ncbi:hypothetical protein DERF_005912 [Dermatophagoides farinae]|uniref:Uncharacterized protein n=1 Tax=Dermatophagoides farinae TaxID=6954 RepID=A0A922I991_DERFA|nr:hypothetical protein DERF_005912 [Dermatophagoides farinae]